MGLLSIAHKYTFILSSGMAFVAMVAGVMTGLYWYGDEVTSTHCQVSRGGMHTNTQDNVCCECDDAPQSTAMLHC